MDLTVIKGLGPARRAKLEDNGVKTLDTLAEADLAALSGTVGISETILEDLQTQAKELQELLAIKGLGEATLVKLTEADVRTVQQLQKADLDAVSEATGISNARLQRFQSAAGAPQPTPKATKAGKAGDDGEVHIESATERAARRITDELDNARVVLQKGFEEAKVKVGDKVVADVKVITAKTRDNVAIQLEKAEGNVVILLEKADTALVRINNKVQEGLPLFQEKAREVVDGVAKDVEEVRVRVEETVKPAFQRMKDRVMSLFQRN